MTDETKTQQTATPDQGGATDNAQTAETPESAVQTEPVSRPWIAPAVASAVAAVSLLVVSIPGVLLYPEQPKLPDRSDRVALEREANKVLEEELARLEQTLGAGVCRENGKLVYAAPPAQGGGAPGAGGATQPGATPPAQPITSQKPQAPGAEPPPLPVSPEEAKPNTGAVPDPQAYKGNLLDLIDQATVLVVTQSAKGSGLGSGFFVAQDVIVTNAHVAPQGTQKVHVLNQATGRPVEAQLLASNLNKGQGQDLALLRLSQPQTSIIPLTLAPTQRLKRVYAAGFPGFLKMDEAREYFKAAGAKKPPTPVTTDGTIINRQSDGSVSLLLHSAPIAKGNSGGPLFDACGRVVGVNTWVADAQTGGKGYRTQLAQAAEMVVEFGKANSVRINYDPNICAPNVQRQQTAPSAGSGAGSGGAQGAQGGAQGGSSQPPAAAPKTGSGQ